MKVFKKTAKKMVILLAVTAFVVGASAKSFAGGTAVVDLDKIRDNYSATQEVTADLKVKEADLQKFLDVAKTQIQNAKTPLEKETLGKKLNEQFNIKRNAYAKDQAQKWSQMEDTVNAAIKEVSSANKYDLVLNKQVVIEGGCDITDDVLKKLNGAAKK